MERLEGYFQYICQLCQDESGDDFKELNNCTPLGTKIRTTESDLGKISDDEFLQRKTKTEDNTDTPICYINRAGVIKLYV